MFRPYFLLACLGIAVASPLGSREFLTPRQQGSGCNSPYGAAGDAPYTSSCSEITSAITCPHGTPGKAPKGVVLLVHGTGSTGPESWQDGPYNVYLPSQGYDVCWVTLPDRSLGDAQISAEYVAYSIGYLSSMSSNKNVSIVGHSQGAGCNPQWALDFWPSTRAKVTAYVSLAGDFHGTDEGRLLCSSQNATCQPSVWQQSTGSRYLAAQNNKGGKALVPTTSIYTLYDDVIQPEIVNPTSNLQGATVYALQDPRICGPTHLADHFYMIIDPAAYALAVDALAHQGAASATRFSKTSCTYLQNNVLASNFASTPDFVRGIFNDVIAVGASPGSTKCEPALQSYVCARGDAPAAYCKATC